MQFDVDKHHMKAGRASSMGLLWFGSGGLVTFVLTSILLVFFRGARGERLEQKRGVPDPLLSVRCCDLPTCRRFQTWGGVV